MDKLPPELLLKIASCCDLAEVFALSKVNRRWNEVIESNLNSLKKIRVGEIFFSEDKDIKSIRCRIRWRALTFDVTQGSENVNASEVLENGWIRDGEIVTQQRPQELVVRPMDAYKYLEDLFTPIFRRSTIHQLTLKHLKSSTLQVMIALLDRFRPTIGTLDITIGSKDGHSYRHDVQELVDSFRIVELSKPDSLRFCFSDGFAREEIRELFVKKMSNLYIPSVDMSYDEWPSVYFEDPETHRPAVRGPLPKCRNLLCIGSEAKGISALEVPDIVLLVEEWSKNERDIEHYELNFFLEDIGVVAAKFEQSLKERNLPVRFEVVQENAGFLIEKIAKRGDIQDRLRLQFLLENDEESSDESDDEDDIAMRDNYVVIWTIEDED